MKAYIATGIKNVEQYARVKQILATEGVSITFDWTEAPALDHRTSGPEHVQRALVDLNGVRAADFVVVLLPAGYGTHVELGAALALGKPVLMIGKHDAPYLSVFHYHPLVTWVDAEKAAISGEAVADFLDFWFGKR